MSKDLLVDVGERNFVKKSIPDTQKLIDEQVEKLKEARVSLNNSIEEVSREAEKLVGDIREDKNCDCGEECEECGCGKRGD